MRLSTQLALAIVGVVLVATTALGLYTYHSVETAILPGRLERAKMRTQLLAQEIEAAAGVRIEAEVAWPGGGRSIYVRDPSGNSVELATAAVWGLASESASRR